MLAYGETVNIPEFDSVLIEKRIVTHFFFWLSAMSVPKVKPKSPNLAQ